MLLEVIQPHEDLEHVALDVRLGILDEPRLLPCMEIRAPSIRGATPCFLGQQTRLACATVQGQSGGAGAKAGGSTT